MEKSTEAGSFASLRYQELNGFAALGWSSWFVDVNRYAMRGSVLVTRPASPPFSHAGSRAVDLARGKCGAKWAQMRGLEWLDLDHLGLGCPSECACHACCALTHVPLGDK